MMGYYFVRTFQIGAILACFAAAALIDQAGPIFS